MLHRRRHKQFVYSSVSSVSSFHPDDPIMQSLGIFEGFLHPQIQAPPALGIFRNSKHETQHSLPIPNIPNWQSYFP